MILNFSQVTQLKNQVKNRFDAQVHFHDGCGGQYFTLEESNENLQKFITEYFADVNLKVSFSDDGLQFSVDNK